MSVNSKTGTIKVAQNKPIGTYFVKVIGVLPDLISSSFFIFKIEIIRNPLHKVSIKLKLIAKVPSNYILHFLQGNPDEYVTHSGILPSFVTFKFPQYSFQPF
jgi:hypothetical protein